jgi:hypothetical protein
MSIKLTIVIFQKMQIILISNLCSGGIKTFMYIFNYYVIINVIKIKRESIFLHHSF